MQVTIISIVIDAFGTVTKGLQKGLEDLEVGGRVETIQTTALLRTARILRRVLETWGDLLSLRLNWKPSANADEKSSNEWIIIIIIIIKLTIISSVIYAFGTVTKGLLKGLEGLEVGGWVETIQTTALLKNARILRRVLETWGDLLSVRLQWKTIGYRWCEKL